MVGSTSLDAALRDDYTGFMQVRSQHLHSLVKALAGINEEAVHEAPPEEMDDSEVDPTQ